MDSGSARGLNPDCSRIHASCQSQVFTKQEDTVEQDFPPGWSRRDFIRGTTTLIGSIPLAGAIAGCEDPENAAFQEEGAMAEPLATTVTATPVTQLEISLTVNNQTSKVTVEPRETLNEVLRYRLGLTGTHLGCDRAACGACTVHLDGKAVYSCTTLAVEADGRKITTIEGLANGSTLDPIQTCFIQNDALQCGFCTSGMIMACKALLNANPAPTEADVKVATAGNLCRCGTYPRVFKATLDAATLISGG